MWPLWSPRCPVLCLGSCDHNGNVIIVITYCTLWSCDHDEHMPVCCSLRLCDCHDLLSVLVSWSCDHRKGCDSEEGSLWQCDRSSDYCLVSYPESSQSGDGVDVRVAGGLWPCQILRWHGHTDLPPGTSLLTLGCQLRSYQTEWQPS